MNTGRTQLVVSAHEAAADLQLCIDRGRALLGELLRSSLPAPERLEQFGAKYWDWHDENSALLRRAFSTTEIEQGYAEIAMEKAAGQLGFADLLRDLALGLQRDIAFLVQLHDRIHGFAGPSAT